MSDLKTCFKAVDYSLDNLLTYIEVGDIGLPELMRGGVRVKTQLTTTST